jgi:formylglycine-generating enzyme required for sulfatase activity
LPEHSCHNLGFRLVEEVEGVDPLSGSYRVNRGGSWYRVAANACVALRDDVSPGDRRHNLGVRLVEEVEALSEPNRVFGGGSWYDDPGRARVALRNSTSPRARYRDLGVRLVEEVVEEADPPSGSNRVRRGGCWYSDDANARVAFRGSYSPGYRIHYLGVRLVEET